MYSQPLKMIITLFIMTFANQSSKGGWITPIVGDTQY